MSKSIFFFTIFVGTSVLFGMLFVVPAFNDFTLLGKSIEQREQEIQSNEDYFEQINALNSQLGSYRSGLENIDYALPDNADLPLFYHTMQQYAAQGGLLLSDLSITAQESADGGVQPIQVSLAAEGSYDSIKNFMTTLQDSAKIFTIESFNTGVGESGSVFLNITYTTYSY